MARVTLAVPSTDARPSRRFEARSLLGGPHQAVRACRQAELFCQPQVAIKSHWRHVHRVLGSVARDARGVRRARGKDVRAAAGCSRKRAATACAAWCSMAHYGSSEKYRGQYRRRLDAVTPTGAEGRGKAFRMKRRFLSGRRQLARPHAPSRRSVSAAMNELLISALGR
jgi:hypothetical protein